MRAVVIGAGIAGLATAALLGKEGYEVTVVDSLDEVGGRAGSYTEAGFRWDTGPSWYLMPDAFDHFFSLCGTSTEAELDLVRLSRITASIPAAPPNPLLAPARALPPWIFTPEPITWPNSSSR